MRFFSSLVLAFSITLSAQAFTLSNSGTEIGYSYSTEFRSVYQDPNSKKLDPVLLATNHITHLDGLFHSPEYANAHGGYDMNLIQGFGGTKPPAVSNAKLFKRAGDPYYWVSYTAKGTMITLKRVADDWLNGRKTAQIKLPLPQDLTALYSGIPKDPNDYDHYPAYANNDWLACTDDHYTDPYDFSYFYDPYRILKINATNGKRDTDRCLKLGQSPIASEVVFTVTDQSPSANENKTLIPKAKLLADNSNGPLVTLYFVNGFSEEFDGTASDRKIKQDFGYLDYAHIEQNFIKSLGFTKFGSAQELQNFLGENSKYLNLNGNPVKLEFSGERRFFSTYGKVIGDKIYIVRNSLFYTENETTANPRRSFPKFWKEAWENGDVIYYGGHSGDGIALSIETMLKNLSKSDIHAIYFKPKKEQVVFFDSCSSYSYYVEEYAKKKPATTSVMTYGVVSLFPVALATLDTFIHEMVSPTPHTWVDFMNDIEHAQLPPMMSWLYTGTNVAAQQRKHERANSYPNFLISVWAP